MDSWTGNTSIRMSFPGSRAGTRSRHGALWSTMAPANTAGNRSTNGSRLKPRWGSRSGWPLTPTRDGAAAATRCLAGTTRRTAPGRPATATSHAVGATTTASTRRISRCIGRNPTWRRSRASSPRPPLATAMTLACPSSRSVPGSTARPRPPRPTTRSRAAWPRPAWIPTGGLQRSTGSWTSTSGTGTTRRCCCSTRHGTNIDWNAASLPTTQAAKASA